MSTMRPVLTTGETTAPGEPSQCAGLGKGSVFIVKPLLLSFYCGPSWPLLQQVFQPYPQGPGIFTVVSYLWTVASGSSYEVTEVKNNLGQHLDDVITGFHWFHLFISLDFILRKFSIQIIPI